MSQLSPNQVEDMRQIGWGTAYIRMLKTIAGLLARKACIAQGVDPDKADEWERGGVRLMYGEPIPEEAVDQATGATVLRRALILIEDKYLYGEVQLVLQPPKTTLHVRALVGNEEFVNEIDPGHRLPVEWIVRSDEYDTGRRLF